MSTPSTTASDFDSCSAGSAWSRAIALFATTTALFLTLIAGASAAPTAKPAVEAFFTSNVTATSADLNALINPQGGPATYRFDLGPGPGATRRWLVMARRGDKGHMTREKRRSE